MDKYMYTGKSSRNPNTPLIMSVLTAIFMLAIAIFMYYYLIDWELSNEKRSMNFLVILLYKAGGKLAVTSFFVLLSLIAFVAGIASTNKLKKIKNNN